MRQAIYKLGGHTFGLSRIRYGIHSEETIDFMADLHYDGKVIAKVSNDGHGAATDYYPYPGVDMDVFRKVAEDVRRFVWIECKDGTKFYHNLGTIADECLYNSLR